MEISRLAPNIEQIQTKFKEKLKEQKEKAGPMEALLAPMLDYVAEYKRYSNSATNYSANSSLQKLSAEYYQVCARNYQRLYEQSVVAGIPLLIEMGVLDKDGKLL